MKQIAIFIAIFLFLRPLLPVGEYLLNYDFIAKELCINKDKPKMQCNGKCHLMKELAKSASEENPVSEKKVNNPHYDLVAFFEEQVAITFSAATFYNACSHTPYKNLYSHHYHSASFRPPSI